MVLLLHSLFSIVLLAGSVHSQNTTTEQYHAFNAARTLSIGIILFPGFTPLDVYGPLTIFRTLSSSYKMTLSLIATRTGPISSLPPPYTLNETDNSPLKDFGHVLNLATTATHTFATAPALDVILVPGGTGNVALVNAKNYELEDFINRRAEAASYILSVCSGAVVLARAGLLKGKRATTNKQLWSWVTQAQHGEGITWVPSARWTEDGKMWTSSGVAAGTDMAVAFMKHLYGDEKVDRAVNGIEYMAMRDKDWDPFSVVLKVPGAMTNRSLTTCLAPYGYESQL